jgi:hypothetical protein
VDPILIFAAGVLCGVVVGAVFAFDSVRRNRRK